MFCASNEEILKSFNQMSYFKTQDYFVALLHLSLIFAYLFIIFFSFSKFPESFQFLLLKTFDFSLLLVLVLVIFFIRFVFCQKQLSELILSSGRARSLICISFWTSASFRSSGSFSNPHKPHALMHVLYCSLSMLYFV